MADISQLQINGTTYDICDATARDSIGQVITMTGDSIFIVGSNFEHRSGQIFIAKKVGGVALINIPVTVLSSISSGSVTVGTLAEGLRPIAYMNYATLSTSPTALIILDISTAGEIIINTSNFPLTAGSTIWIRVTILTGY